MRDEAVRRQRQIMANHGLEGLVAISPENFAWTVGFVVPSQPLLRWRHAMSVVKADGTRAVVVVDIEARTVRERLPNERVLAWGEFGGGSAMQTLGAVLTDMGLSVGRIGIELDYLPAGDFLVLQRTVPSVELVPAETLFARARQIKSTDEIRLLRQLALIADAAIADAYAGVHPGDSEMDLAAHVVRGVYAGGADQLRLMVVATGERSVHPNVGPSHRVLQRGDVCRVEIFPTSNGYHAGVCRTAMVETAPRHAMQIWQKLVESKYVVLEMIKPGATTRSIYEAYVAKLAEMELTPISFVGHSIGLHLHEEPYLSKYDTGVLEEGMVLGIEPLVYDTGHGYGLQIKDLVAVTATGAELLSSHTNTDRMAVIS